MVITIKYIPSHMCMQSSSKVMTLQFVPRIKGKRAVQKISLADFEKLVQKKQRSPDFNHQEYFDGETLVKPYYDWDAKSNDRFTEESLAAHLQQFKDILHRLHPNADIVFAQRHGEIQGSAGTRSYKISYRAFVQNVKVKAHLIPSFVRHTLQMGPKETHEHLDLSVYKVKEQLLGVIHGCKDTDIIKRYLTPLGESQCPLKSFLAQAVEDNDEILQVPLDAGASTGRSPGSASKGKEKIEASVLANSGDEEMLNAASEFFNSEFQLDEKFESLQRHDEEFIFPTVKKHCWIRGSAHRSNNGFIRVSREGYRFCCHDEECQKVDVVLQHFGRLPVVIQQCFLKEFPLDDKQGREAIHKGLKHIKQHLPQMDLTVKKSEIHQTCVGWACVLDKNRFCPLHNIKHDEPQNYMLTKIDGNCFVGCKRDPTRFHPTGHTGFQMPKTVTNVLVQYLVDNRTIIQGDADGTFLDGHFETIEPIFEDKTLNELIFNSLNGLSYDIAAVVHYLGRHLFGITSDKKDDWWAWNVEHGLWQKSVRQAENFLATVVTNKYLTVQNYFAQQTSNPQLAKIRSLKLNAIIKRLKDNDKYQILHDTATHFSIHEGCIERRLDANQSLLGFDGWVYDLETSEYRPAESSDYLTQSCGYRLPEPDPSVQAEIKAFFASIQETQEDVDYLLKSMAASLDGFNKDECFHLWIGGGRNGKGVAADLLSRALGGHPNQTKILDCPGYHYTVGATLLTHARPSTSSPVPDLLHFKGQRIVTISEPETGSKVNSGFLKSLTGGDTISGRYLHSNVDVKFQPQHSIIILSNNGCLAFDAEDDAVWLRSRFVRFPYTFVAHPTAPNEKLIDMNLKKKLSTWAPQFMLILLEYYKKYQSDGRLIPTDKVLKANIDVRNENDICATFITEHLTITDDEMDRIRASEVGDAFILWCRKNSTNIVKPNKMKSQLKEKLVALGKSPQSRWIPERKESFIAYEGLKWSAPL